jgi:hypothetical protein
MTSEFPRAVIASANIPARPYHAGCISNLSYAWDCELTRTPINVPVRSACTVPYQRHTRHELNVYAPPSCEALSEAVEQQMLEFARVLRVHF